MQKDSKEELSAEIQLSRSEQKRRAHRVEELAGELIELSEHDIRGLPCESYLKDEMVVARDLKSGARKRQIKYLARELRKIDAEPLYLFLEEKKGSQLKQNREHQQLEHLRDAILTDAIHAFEEARHADEPLGGWESPALNETGELFPRLDIAAIRSAAGRYARTRKPVYSREIFRQLKSAFEQRERQQSKGQ